MKDKDPDRLYCRKKDRKEYELLAKEGPFEGKKLIDIFMMAMIAGFHEAHKIELDKKEGLILLQYVPRKQKTIIKAIAVAEEGNLDILLDKKRVYSIAEEFATGGIKSLKEKVFSGDYGSYIKRFESELAEEFENNVKDTEKG